MIFFFYSLVGQLYVLAHIDQRNRMARRYKIRLRWDAADLFVAVLLWLGWPIWVAISIIDKTAGIL